MLKYSSKQACCLYVLYTCIDTGLVRGQTVLTYVGYSVRTSNACNSSRQQMRWWRSGIAL